MERKRRHGGAVISLLLLLAALGLGAWAQRNVDLRVNLTDALLLYAAAALLAVMGYRHIRLPAVEMAGEGRDDTTPRPACRLSSRDSHSTLRRAGANHTRGGDALLPWSRRILGILGVCLAAAALQLLRTNDWNAGFLSWLLALAALLGAAWLDDRASPSPLPPSLAAAGRNILRPVPLALAAILLVGLFLRLYRIDELPAGLHNDSAWNGLYAIKLLQGTPFTPYTPEGGAGRETMHLYLTALLIELLGPTITAIRLSSTFWTVLTLLLFYPLARQLLGRRDAVLATFLLATATWALVFSRVGWRAISVPFVEVFTFFFLLRALRLRRSLDYALAGVGLALCYNTYDAGRMGPFIAGVFLFFLVVRERGFLRRHGRGLSLMALLAVVAILPIAVYAGGRWTEFTNRAQQLSVLAEAQRSGSYAPLFENLKTAALIFNYRANGNDFMINEPLLDLPLAVFFVLGFVYALLYWRRPVPFLLLAWLLLSLATSVLAIPNGNRAIGAMAPALLIAALFPAALWQAATNVGGRRAQAPLAALTAVVFVGMTYHAYSLHLGPQPRRLHGMFEDGVAVGRVVGQLADDGTRLYLSDRYYVANTVRYAGYRPWENPFSRPYQTFDAAAALTFGRGAPEEDTAFLLEPTDRNRQIAALLKSRYLLATIEELGSVGAAGRPALLAVRVAKGGPTSVSFSNGLRARYYRGVDWQGDPVYDLIDPLIAVNRQLSLPSFSVRWEGEIEAPMSGRYTFETLSDDGSFVYVDGRLIVDNGGAHAARVRSGTIDLAKGRHPIEIRYFNEGSGMALEVYWMGPDRGKEQLPAQALFPVGVTPALVVEVPSPRAAPPSAPTSVVVLDAGVAGGAKLLRKLGGPGTGPGLLKQPKDVALAADGGLYVADAGNGRVQRWDGAGSYRSQLGQAGGGPGDFKQPLALAVDGQGTLFVLDEETGYVSRFGPDDAFLGRFGGPEARFYHPRGLAVAPDGTVYVADTGFARLVAFSPDGRKLRELGGRGEAPGQLRGPVGLAVDGEGRLWVADVDNQRVQRLGPDGTYLGSFAIPRGESVDGAHLALWPGGLYLTDPVRDRVLAYSFDGRLLGEWGERGEGDGQLRRPIGLAVDSSGTVWVAERDNHRVQQFQPPR